MNGGERFPTVVGTNLAGTSVRLPDQLDGRLNLLLIAFRQIQQGDVDTWLPYTDALELRRTDVRAYELPVLSAAYRLARPFIDGTPAPGRSRARSSHAPGTGFGRPTSGGTGGARNRTAWRTTRSTPWRPTSSG